MSPILTAMRIRAKAIEPKWFLVISFFIAGLFLGGLGLYLWLNIQSPQLQKIHLSGSSYQYINPLLAVDIREGRHFFQNKSLELKLQGFINAQKENHSITDTAVYFRDLETGTWTGINEGLNFSPGNLLKLPIMITYLKLAETDPSILGKSLKFYGGGLSTHNLFQPTDLLKVGSSYTVDELLRRMIVNSDDNAAALLFDNVDKASLNEVFSDLGVIYKEDAEKPDFIGLKAYTIFFRVLYNATYLNRDFSEKALELLVDADNSIGVGAGLPKDIPVANRLGGRTFTVGSKQLFEMHDCGVIYYPSHPYLLCSAVQGDNLDNLKSFLKELGGIINGEVNYEYKS